MSDDRQYRRWFRTMLVAICILGFGLSFTLWQQRKNFAEHRGIDSAQEHRTCLLLQSRWDIINEVIVVTFAPNASDSAARVAEKGRKQRTLIRDLGARTECR